MSKKISELTEASAVPINSYTVIVDGNDNKKIKVETITKNLSDRMDTVSNQLDSLSNVDDEISTKLTDLENRLGVNVIEVQEINEQLQDLFQSVSSGKSLIASAIADMGVPTLATDTFETMANNIRNITLLSGDAIVLETGEFLVGYDNGVIQEPEGGGNVEEVIKANYIDVTQEPRATSSFTNWSSSAANSMTITAGAYRTRYVSYVIELPSNSSFKFSCNYAVTTGKCNVRIFDSSGAILAQTGFTNGSTGSGQYNLSFSSGSEDGSYTVYFYATDNSGTYEEANVTFSEVKIEKVV